MAHRPDPQELEARLEAEARGVPIEPHPRELGDEPGGVAWVTWGLIAVWVSLWFWGLGTEDAPATGPWNLEEAPARWESLAWRPEVSGANRLLHGLVHGTHWQLLWSMLVLGWCGRDVEHLLGRPRYALLLVLGFLGAAPVTWAFSGAAPITGGWAAGFAVVGWWLGKDHRAVLPYPVSAAPQLWRTYAGGDHWRWLWFPRLPVWLALFLFLFLQGWRPVAFEIDGHFTWSHHPLQQTLAGVVVGYAFAKRDGVDLE